MSESDDLIPIPFLFLIDVFGNWNNHPIIQCHDQGTKEDRVLKLKSRLDKYRYDCKNQGKEFVDSIRETTKQMEIY